MIAPRATYRLQLHRDFGFDAASARVAELSALGISHLYLSPITTARPGSRHGYDVIDPTTINPELGGEAGFRALVDTARGHDLGILLDIVPNHMAATAENPWWRDVLRHGRDSVHAGWFDIDFEAGAHGRVLLPLLGKPYVQALAAGDLVLEWSADRAELELVVHGTHRLPLRRADAALVLAPLAMGGLQAADDAALADQVVAAGADALASALARYDARDSAGRVRLHALIERQAWSLRWWRTANDAVNWRRFFDVNELVALRMEHRAAFDAHHALVLALWRDDLIDGLRIDHIDGLADPRGYLRQLDAALRGAAPERAPWVLVEKILEAGERLPEDWPVDGTTGYDFMDEVAGLLHARSGAAPLRALWRELTGESARFGPVARRARRQILREHFGAAFERTVDALVPVVEARLEGRELPRRALARALEAICVAFSPYRDYAGDAAAAQDPRPLARAVDEARKRLPPRLGYALDAVASALKGENGAASHHGTLLRRFRHLTAPLAAKALEDTAFYRHGVLLSRCEVGADPTRFAQSARGFHAHARRRAHAAPRALLATATHDHKRGEDARMRLAVLSERPALWREQVLAWDRHAIAISEPIHPADRLMLYQTLVGAWPPDAAAHLPDDFAERIIAWQSKALREGKQRSHWADPDEAYEARARAFTTAVLADAELRGSIADFVVAIGPAAAAKSLAQLVLRLTVPGIPDQYQGTEHWDHSLVDPDNRRPVPTRPLREGAPVELAAAWQDGSIKREILHRVLRLRAERRGLFSGGYTPVHGTGPGFAFTRSQGALLVAVLIRSADQVDESLRPRWTDGAAGSRTASRLSRARYSELLTGEVAEHGPDTPMRALLPRLPVAIWVRD